MALPQLERDGDFDDHVNRDAVTMGRREPPLAYRLDGAVIQPVAETAFDPHVPD
jgi:hypothetical protein